MENIADKEGAKPAEDTKDVKDTKDVTPEPSTGKTEPPEPWHKDPRFKSELENLKALKRLKESNGIESIDELAELVEQGKKVKGKSVDLDRLDEILAKSEKLDKYEAYWRDQEEKKKRETEYPEQTIARLEEQLKRKESADRRKEEQRIAQETAQRALKAYDNEVQSLIREIDVPKEQRDFILKFFGVGNAFNEIDITDKKAIKRLISDGIKEKEAYDQAVIQAYLKTKEDIPKTSSAAPAAPGTPSKIMLKDARKALLDAFNVRR